jgi:hypothetical protein
VIRALSFAEVQEVIDAFVPLATWSGLPIRPGRIAGTCLTEAEGPPSLLKVEDTAAGPDGDLADIACYAPGLRRFAIHPTDGAADRPWRVSLNTIGVMVNPTSLRPTEFGRECYRCLLALEAEEPFEAGWLDEPVLWPKRLTRVADLTAARRAIPDLRPTETILYARSVLGATSYLARVVPGRSWPDLDWRSAAGDPVRLVPAKDRAVGAVRTWRMFLRGFLTHRVAFTLGADGRRTDGESRGVLTPAPILLIGAVRTGRTAWASGERGETLLPDPGESARIAAGLVGLSEAEFRRAGLAPRTARAMRAGRRPVRRNAEAARRLVADRSRAAAGLVRNRARYCLAPGCPVRLTGRQRSFCALHAAYPGSRRKAWREAAGA